jgi:hypothetical protein
MLLFFNFDIIVLVLFSDLTGLPGTFNFIFFIYYYLFAFGRYADTLYTRRLYSICLSIKCEEALQPASGGTSKLKTPPICTKVPPFERARQGDSDSINLISIKPNPAIQNASEILKTRLFTTLLINKSDPVDKFTRYAI